MKIDVRVVPGSSKRSVIKLPDGNLLVRVTERPDKGKANKAAIEILADYLNIPKSRLSISSGATSRKKIIEISD